MSRKLSDVELALLLGFAVSREGWNGEYPFGLEGVARFPLESQLAWAISDLGEEQAGHQNRRALRESMTGRIGSGRRVDRGTEETTDGGSSGDRAMRNSAFVPKVPMPKKVPMRLVLTITGEQDDEWDWDGQFPLDRAFFAPIRKWRAEIRIPCADIRIGDGPFELPPTEPDATRWPTHGWIVTELPGYPDVDGNQIAVLEVTER